MNYNTKIRMSNKTTFIKFIFPLVFIILVFETKLNAQTGNTCGSPITIAGLPFNHSGNTSSYGDDYTNTDVPTTATGAVTNGTGSAYYITGDDVVFAYTPPCNEVITISTTNDNSWIGLWAFTGCPFSSTVGYHTATSGTTRQISNLSVIGGVTYYFVISSWPSPQSTSYTINITQISGCTTTATCSDGIQNQGETGIDCGGPCPACPTGPNLIPSACSNITYNMTANTSITFYDDGGPGGNPCADAAVSTGNYCNCNCFTTVTICAAAGQYIIADFREFAMWNTTSGWDWMRIYNGPNTSSPVMYDNSSTGANNPMGDCGIGSNVLNFCSSGQCMTFQFWATSVVNRAGWDALVSSVPGFCTPLPVELLSFTGEAVEETNVLNWTTTSEINNDYFIVEASVDAENFSSIGTVAGAGNSNEVLNYEFIDNNPYAKTMYYRLKQVDFDGKWENSEIVAINRNSLGIIDIFPNPVNDLLHINFNTNEVNDYKVSITNILGEVITETTNLGKNKLTLNVFEELSGGVYFVKIVDDSNQLITTKKIIKN